MKHPNHPPESVLIRGSCWSFALRVSLSIELL